MVPPLTRRATSAFTLAEVLAALLFMAILIPVTMHGVSVASRAGLVGNRKAAAMRVAERVLEEQIVSNQLGLGTPYGTIVEGDVSYPWSLKIDPWTADQASGLNVISVRVEFVVQGATYDVVVSTLHDPVAPVAVPTSTTTSSTTASTGQ